MENLTLNLEAQDNYFKQLLGKKKKKKVQPAEAEEELKVHVLWQSSEETGGILTAHLKAQKWDGVM